MSDPNAPGSVPPTSAHDTRTRSPAVGHADVRRSERPTPPAGVPSLPDGTPGRPTEATTQMPVAGAGVPPGMPPGTGFGDPLDDEPPTPWYKQPGPVIAIIIVLAAIGGLIAWLILGGDDDDPVASAESSLLVLEVTDETGASLDAGFIVNVDGPAASQFVYTWIQPASAVAGEVAGDSTGSDGVVEFEWEPTGVDSDPTTWAATVAIAQQIPAGWTPPGPIVECVLERPDAAGHRRVDGHRRRRARCGGRPDRQLHVPELPVPRR